jgi:hypothetical protein
VTKVARLLRLGNRCDRSGRPSALGHSQSRLRRSGYFFRLTSRIFTRDAPRSRWRLPRITWSLRSPPSQSGVWPTASAHGSVILAGSAALGAILLSARVVGSQLWQQYLLYGLLAAAGAATTSVPYALVVSRWFNRRRGLALGLMTVAFMLIGASVHACIIHLPQLIADHQSSTGRAALVTSVLGLALLLGRAGTGYFLDRHFAPRVASLVFASAAVGILLLWLGANMHCS